MKMWKLIVSIAAGIILAVMILSVVLAAFTAYVRQMDFPKPRIKVTLPEKTRNLE